VAEVERVGTSDTVRYPYFDHLGSPVKMGNASGGLINSEQAIFCPLASDGVQQIKRRMGEDLPAT